MKNSSIALLRLLLLSVPALALGASALLASKPAVAKSETVYRARIITGRIESDLDRLGYVVEVNAPAAANPGGEGFELTEDQAHCLVLQAKELLSLPPSEKHRDFQLNLVSDKSTKRVVWQDTRFTEHDVVINALAPDSFSNECQIATAIEIAMEASKSGGSACYASGDPDIINFIDKSLR